MVHCIPQKSRCEVCNILIYMACISASHVHISIIHGEKIMVVLSSFPVILSPLYTDDKLVAFFMVGACI